MNLDAPTVPSIADFEIVSIRDAGILERERLVLKAMRPINLIRYAVIPTGWNEADKTLIDLNREVFWFPATDVAEGDIIHLYTSPGDSRFFANKGGTKTYVFYWDRDAPVWGRHSVGAVVVLRIAGGPVVSFATREDSSIDQAE